MVSVVKVKAPVGFGTSNSVSNLFSPELMAPAVPITFAGNFRPGYWSTAQVEAVLNGSIMLSIGFYDYVLEEDEQEQISGRSLLRSRAVKD